MTPEPILAGHSFFWIVVIVTLIGLGTGALTWMEEHRPERPEVEPEPRKPCAAAHCGLEGTIPVETPDGRTVHYCPGDYDQMQFRGWTA